MTKLLVTPTGILTGFIAIERPSTKFHDDGVYSCQMAFTGEDATVMKRNIDGYIKDSLSTASNANKSAAPPYTIDGETLIVKFKSNALIRKRNGEVINLNIKLYDASNKEITAPIGIGEGSLAKIAYKPYLWAVSALGAGCTLQLSMIQVVDLVRSEYLDGMSATPFKKLEGYTMDTPFNDDNDMEEPTPKHSEVTDNKNEEIDF